LKLTGKAEIMRLLESLPAREDIFPLKNQEVHFNLYPDFSCTPEGMIMKLEKDLYAYLWLDPYENNCNTYLIRGEVTVLIDPGHSRHLPNLFHQMEEDGISPEEIDLVILTHSHPDHFEGLEAFMNIPVKIAMNWDEIDGEAYVNTFKKIMLKGLMV